MTKTWQLVLMTAIVVAACGSQDTDVPSTTQTPQGTDILLGSLHLDSDSTAVMGLVNITYREGYDNQPHFSPDGRFLYYPSVREDAQADIYRYDLAERVTTRVTETNESEYSATPIPGDNAIAVVRVERDSTQRLWRFPLADGEPSVILAGVKPVGYHAWGDGRTVAMFVLGDSITPNSLQVGDIESARIQTVARRVGRSLHKVPTRRAISFVDQASESDWWISELDIDTWTPTRLTKTLPDSQDYAWAPDGSVFMGHGAVLYRWQPGSDWKDVADLSPAGVQDITRLAIDPAGSRIAIVVN